MKAAINALWGAALLAAPALGHSAIKPPSPDKALRPNSSNAPPGCKLLASDKGWPEDEVWKKEFPGVFKKLKGTEGPDFMIQAKTVEDVQKAVNFAREKNIRLTVIATGHDFHGRETARSGIRLDMASFREPTVFSNTWKCGETLKPKDAAGRVVERVEACEFHKNRKRHWDTAVPQRNVGFHYFRKRDGMGCDQHLRKLRRRHGPDGDDEMPAAPAKAPAKSAPKGAPKDGPVMKPSGGHAHGGAMEEPMMGGHAHGGAKEAPAKKPSGGHAHGGEKPKAGPPMKASGGHGHGDSGHGHGSSAAAPGTTGDVPEYNTIQNNGKPAFARITAGVYNELFYTQADKSGYMTPGAQHGGVSVLGGWMQAGGHNPFVNRIGMMVDNIVELEVVTPDGKFHKVSECNEPELFWAFRGGGGSTFGVVTAATVKVHPTFKVAVSRFFVNATGPEIFEAQAHFLRRSAEMRDQYGMMGYFYLYPTGFQSTLAFPDQFGTIENAKKATEVIQGEMEQIAKAQHIEPMYYEYPTYQKWYAAEQGDESMEDTGEQMLSYYDGSTGDVPSQEEAMMNPARMLPWALKFPQGASASKRDLSAQENVAMGGGVMRSQAMARTYLDSRLLSEKMMNAVPIQRFADALNQTLVRIPGIHVRGFLYGGGAQAKPDKDAMALNPAWREATVHFIINAVPGNARRDYNIKPIAELFPEAGGYLNEASPHWAGWKKSYWGEHYPKLEALKRKIDPTNVFWCTPCVGADLLTYDDERLCDNPAYPVDGPPPATYANKNSTTGIASLPGDPGIPNPMLPLVKAFLANGSIPASFPRSSYFKIAMGEGGSAGGKFSDMDPYRPGEKLKPEDRLWIEQPAAPAPAPAPAPAAPAAEEAAPAPAAEEATPVQETPKPAQEAAPAPAKEEAPKAEAAPAQEKAPAKAKAPAKEKAPAKDEAAAPEAAPAEEPAPAPAPPKTGKSKGNKGKGLGGLFGKKGGGAARTAGEAGEGLQRRAVKGVLRMG